MAIRSALPEVTDQMTLEDEYDRVRDEAEQSVESNSVDDPEEFLASEDAPVEEEDG